MDRWPDLIFVLGVTWLMLHELDAIRQGEWRFFFGGLKWDDERAYHAFVTAHIPLFVFILWHLQAGWFQLIFDVFLIGHAIAHTLLRHHPHIRFNNAFSRWWIYGGAILGGAHLMLMINTGP